MLFHLWYMLGGIAWIWMKTNTFQFNKRQTHFSTSFPCQNEFDPKWNDTECPQNLQARTTNIPNIEGYCMQNNQLPTKNHIELEDKLEDNSDISSKSDCNWNDLSMKARVNKLLPKILDQKYKSPQLSLSYHLFITTPCSTAERLLYIALPIIFCNGSGPKLRLSWASCKTAWSHEDLFDHTFLLKNNTININSCENHFDAP